MTTMWPLPQAISRDFYVTTTIGHHLYVELEEDIGNEDVVQMALVTREEYHWDPLLEGEGVEEVVKVQGRMMARLACSLLVLPGASVYGSSVHTCVGRAGQTPSALCMMRACGETREKK